VVLRADFAPLFERRWRVGMEAAIERHSRVSVNATPSRGAYEPTPFVLTDRIDRATLFARHPTSLGLFGTEVSLATSLDVLRSSASSSTIGRVALDLGIERPFGHDRLVLRTIAGGVGGITGMRIPVQYETWLGGPVSAPGEGYSALRGRSGISQRIEWQHNVPGPSSPLGRYGRVPGQVTLAPFAMLAWTDGKTVSGRPVRRGVHPALGLGGIGLFNLLRVDAARGLRDGRWLLSVDVTRDFWRIL
jgi:hypothetical protein